MAELVFVCGPHCSGKTSLLESLRSRGEIVQRGSEIGKDLYYERKFQTESQNHDFEIEVANRELERDLSYSKMQGMIGVETWHPGNIAYAAIRNPDSVEELIELAKTSPFIKDAKGVWLRIPQETIMERTQTFKDNKEWAGEFYSKIDRQIEQILNRLGLLSNTICIDANRPKEEVLEEVQNFIYPFKKEIINT